MNVAVQTPSLALRTFMADAQQREVECQAFLPQAHLLLAPPLSRVVQVVREQVAMAGRSDYFLLCEMAEVDMRRRLWLWEAKAPQLAPFETSSSLNRLIPSQALIEAENQLLYYYDEYRSNGQFLDRYQLRHPDDVKLGGIIIGRNDNWVRRGRGNVQPDDVLRQLASSALRIRNEHFYHDRIRVLTWSHIADVLDANSVQQTPVP